MPILPNLHYQTPRHAASSSYSSGNGEAGPFKTPPRRSDVQGADGGIYPYKELDTDSFELSNSQFQDRDEIIRSIKRGAAGSSLWDSDHTVSQFGVSYHLSLKYNKKKEIRADRF